MKSDEPVRLTLQEYIKLEEVSEGRHELVSGEVRLRSGGTERHDLVTQLMNVALFQAFRGGGCRVFTHNRKLLIPQDGNVYYPDLMVTCRRDAHRHYEVDASFIIEVISPTNQPGELYDKLVHYQLVPSIVAIAFVDPDKRVATVHAPARDGVDGTPDRLRCVDPWPGSHGPRRDLRRGGRDGCR